MSLFVCPGIDREIERALGTENDFSYDLMLAVLFHLKPALSTVVSRCSHELNSNSILSSSAAADVGSEFDFGSSSAFISELVESELHKELPSIIVSCCMRSFKKFFEPKTTLQTKSQKLSSEGLPTCVCDIAASFVIEHVI